jgi:hypothetical protein
VRGLIGDPRTAIVILLPRPNKTAESVLSLLGLGGVPVLAASPRLYGLYNVRVAPWIMCVDSDGTVRASSLVNHEWQIGRLRKLADLRPQDAPSPPGRAEAAVASSGAEASGGGSR